MPAGEDDEVPRIGRGPLRTHFPAAQIVKILMMIACLVAIILLRKSCAEGVKNWFNTVAPPVAADAGR